MSGRFRIERGTLVAADDGARACLAERSGEYISAPTIPDLLWLVRTEPGGGEVPKPRAIMAGDASGFPLPDLVAFLGQARWTGSIRVLAPNGQRAIALRDGEIRAATTDHPPERLGEVMVRLGYIDRATLELGLREAPPSKLGKLLVERGLLKPHDLFRCVNQQVTEIFEAMLLSREGTFFLTDQVLDERAAQNVQISLQSLLMDAIRKSDELAHFRKRIPHGRVHVVRRPGGNEARLEPEEALVLSLVDGQRTVQELGAAARIAEFEVTKIVNRLIETRCAEVSERPVAPGEAAIVPSIAPLAPPAQPVVSAPTLAVVSAPPTPRPALEPYAVVRAFNRVYSEIRAEVAKQDMDRELLAAANAALGGNALTDSPVLVGLCLDRVGHLPEAKVLDQFARVRHQLGPEPVDELKQALSDVMFFLLFQAGELLESNQDELLGRKVREILAVLDPA